MIFTRPAHRKVEAPSGIITDGLLLRWAMDEGSGTVLGDDSGNGHNGTLVGGQPANWVPGFQGTGVFSADGTSVYGLNTTLNVHENPAISLCIQVKTTAITSGVRYIMHLADGGFTGPSFYTSSSTLTFNIRTSWGGGAAVSISNAPIFDDVWHSLIGTYDSSVMDVIFYLDGVEANRGSTAGVGVGANDGEIAFARAGSSLIFPRLNTNYDDMRVYDRALTPAECALIAAGNG